MATVDFGLDALIAKLESIGNEARIREVKEKALKKVGAVMLSFAVKETPTDTGFLKGSWYVYTNGDRVWLLNSAYYARYVNYGRRVKKGGVTVGFKKGNFTLERALGTTVKYHLQNIMREVIREVVDW